MSDLAPITKNIDMSSVDLEDRPGMRTIIHGILRLNDPVPNVEIHISANEDSYNINCKGWTQYIDGSLVDKTFIQHGKETTYDNVTAWGWYPADDSGQGILHFKVRRSKFGKGKKKK
jgi:hypothetical protein